MKLIAENGRWKSDQLYRGTKQLLAEIGGGSHFYLIMIGSLIPELLNAAALVGRARQFCNERSLGHVNVPNSESFQGSMNEWGFAVEDSGDYFLKPFTHGQMSSMVEVGIIGPQVLEWLINVVRCFPGTGAEIFVN